MEEKIKKLTDLIISTTLDDLKRTYEKQLQDIVSKIKEIDENSNGETDYSIPYRTSLDKSVKFLKSPYSVWKDLGLVEQQRLFFFIFEEKLWYDKNTGYRTDKIQSYTRLFEEFATADSVNVDHSGFEPLTSSLQMRRSTN